MDNPYNTGKRIAVDFDGTVVEHNYPAIGKEMMFAFNTLRALREKGNQLILWTYREGTPLEEAVFFCKQNGFVFDAVNENYPGERQEGTYNRKLNADLFIDDRNLGGFPGWVRVWQLLYPDGQSFDHILTDERAHTNYRSVPFLQTLKQIFNR